MQKKVTNSKNNKKKASPRDASKEVRNKSIFNYDLEVDRENKPKQKKVTKTIKSGNRKAKEDNEKYIDTKEIPKIDPKKLEKIKKRKRKENAKKRKEIKKQEKAEEKQRNKHKKKMTTRDAKQIMMLKKKMKVIGIVIIVIVAIVLFMISPIFNLKEIIVKGNSNISKEKIISLSQIENQTNLFKIRKKEVKNNVKEEPYIEKVSVRRILPSKIQITVEERTLEYLFEFANSYAYVASEAYILEISEEDVADKLKIKGYATSEEMIKPGNRLCKEDIDSLNDVIIIMEAAKNHGLDEYIKKIDISDKEDYLLYIESEKKTVHLGDTSNLDTKMPYIKVIMDREKDIEGEIFVNVDLRNKYPYFSENVYK